MTDFVSLEKRDGVAIVTLNSPETRNTLSSEREYACGDIGRAKNVRAAIVTGAVKAAEMTFTGDPIGAEEALACGLVSKVIPAASLMDGALKLAGRIAANPGHQLRMAKRLIREAQTSRLETILEMSAAFQALAHSTDEHRALVAEAVARVSKSRKG